MLDIDSDIERRVFLNVSLTVESQIGKSSIMKTPRTDSRTCCETGRPRRTPPSTSSSATSSRRSRRCSEWGVSEGSSGRCLPTSQSQARAQCRSSEGAVSIGLKRHQHHFTGVDCVQCGPELRKSYPLDPKRKEHVPFNELWRDEDTFSRNESVMLIVRR